MAKNSTASATSRKETAAPRTPKASGKTVKKPRKIQKARYQSFRLQKRINPDSSKKLIGSFALFRQALSTLKHHWRVFGMLIVIYALFNFIVVRGFSSGGDVGSIKTALEGMFGGAGGSLLSGISLFVYMIGTSGSQANATSGAYQLIIVVIMSLALIWLLRQVYAHKPASARAALYGGMYPLVPFMLVLFMVALQFAPAVVGGILYTSVVSGGISTTGIETALWGVILALTILLTLYMVTSSIFALYIVCLPDMTPLKALRSARQLVAARRWTILRKVVFLPLALLLIGAVLVVPFIIFAAPIASWVFFIVSMASLAVLHSYLYALYRALL